MELYNSGLTDLTYPDVTKMLQKPNMRRVEKSIEKLVMHFTNF